ncbi:hypothetical protein M9H77_01597 [Catharanthus roseus]|uniref:Uncharacterized protein n=1 Tax=Catharanthus roseus TaxID=4058 RepID=A0ACC0C656_CATRO|nr:hypothetical protein M9H77_01597 [Catharanthus roseus]
MWCPFKLKGKQMATNKSWQLFIHNGRHNHKVVVYNHSHAQAARPTEEQLHQTEQFRNSHVPPHNILQFLREQDVGCAVSAQKIYNVVAKIKRNRTQGRNTVEEVLCLSAEKGYTVFHRKREESNVLSDIIVAHPTSIAMIRTWPYILITDITYKTNKYSMPLLEVVGMTPTGKNFTVAITFMCNEQATTYRWVWTSQVLHFGVETTNRAESEHSVLKVWLSTCHGDLDTVFLNIDSLIQGRLKSLADQVLDREAGQIQVLVLVHIEEVGRLVAVEVGAMDVTVGNGVDRASGFTYEDCGFRVVSNFLFGDENHWVEIRKRMCFDLHHPTLARWTLFASTTGAMGISSRRTS